MLMSVLLLSIIFTDGVTAHENHTHHDDEIESIILYPATDWPDCNYLEKYWDDLLIDFYVYMTGYLKHYMTDGDGLFFVEFIPLWESIVDNPYQNDLLKITNVMVEDGCLEEKSYGEH